MMSAKSVTTENIREELVDDLKDKTNTDSEALDPTKLAALKAKLAQKADMAAKVVEKKTRSIRIGVVGSGQAGSRLAEAFYKNGYDTIVINTATQDLKFIDVPESNKLLLDYGLGGAAKELSIGHAAAEAHKDSIAELISAKLDSAQVNLLCISLGGGSGAGSCETMVDILSSTGKPLAVMAALPMNAEDAQTKHNALETLAKLSKFAQTKKINNLIVVDNAKIESIYSNVSQLDFYKVANRAIVEPVDMFNTLSSMPSDVKGLDPMEWGKLLTDGEGLSVYGEMVVKNYVGETALAEAVMENLNGNLLAGGFDLTQSRYVGVILTAPKAVWDRIPSMHTNYALAMVNEQCGNPKGVFKGIYTIEDGTDEVKIYSWFAGLGLPESRVTQLKNESKSLSENVRTKDAARNLTLNLDTGVHDTINEAQKIREKVAANRSSFGKLMNNVIDKRKG
jgi:cell division GTPase FtsZ